MAVRGSFKEKIETKTRNEQGARVSCAHIIHFEKQVFFLEDRAKFLAPAIEVVPFLEISKAEEVIDILIPTPLTKNSTHYCSNHY